MIQIFLDENLSEYVADALNSLNKGYFTEVQVSSTKHRFGKGVKDSELIPKVGQEKGILISRDINISRDKLESSLLKEYNVGIFYISLPKGQNNHWNMVKVLIENWEEIISICKKKHPPFAYRVPIRGAMKKLD